jgi:hypothetical protein
MMSEQTKTEIVAMSASMNKEDFCLKNARPCPSGHNREHLALGDSGDHWHYVICLHEGCGWRGPYDLDRNCAVVRWNERQLTGEIAAIWARLIRDWWGDAEEICLMVTTEEERETALKELNEHLLQVWTRKSKRLTS